MKDAEKKTGFHRAKNVAHEIKYCVQPSNSDFVRKNGREKTSA